MIDLRLPAILPNGEQWCDLRWRTRAYEKQIHSRQLVVDLLSNWSLTFCLLGHWSIIPSDTDVLSHLLIGHWSIIALDTDVLSHLLIGHWLNVPLDTDVLSHLLIGHRLIVPLVTDAMSHRLIGHWPNVPLTNWSLTHCPMHSENHHHHSEVSNHYV